MTAIKDDHESLFFLHLLLQLLYLVQQIGFGVLGWNAVDLGVEIVGALKDTLQVSDLPPDAVLFVFPTQEEGEDLVVRV